VLFGGVYSNFQALEALIAVVGDQPAICTGDVVGYCAEASASVELVRKTGWPVVAGNCERQIADAAPDCGCGFGVGSACEVLSRGWYPHAVAQIGPDERAWMEALPDIGVFQQQGRRYAVLHGGASANNRFLWPSTSIGDFSIEIEALEALTGPVHGIVAGHSGIAFQRRLGSRVWINAGAIGMPPHDGRSQTRFAVLDTGEVTFERLSYDVSRTISEMKSAGLDQGYEVALQTGFWPSEDVLPSELRR